MADKISTSKKEIYEKLLSIAEKYTDKDTDFLKTGLFGYLTESMAMMIRDSTFHKSMLYNESFLNTASIPRSVYNWAKTFNVEVQKATPSYATIEIEIPETTVSTNLTTPNSFKLSRYGSDIKDIKCLILNKEDPIIAGEYYFALEHSIMIYYAGNNTKDYLTAKYILSEYDSTNYQGITNESNVLLIKSENGNIKITARAYQYKRQAITRQITSQTFLNKVQTYEFEDQFCGARLFYTENNNDYEIKLQFSDLKLDSDKTAFYNLSDENELQVIFKSGDSYFTPGPNSKITLYIYTTKGKNVPRIYDGDALMLISDNDLKSLPLVIHFNPTNILGGKNKPSLTQIKQTIINEISTRNTITTQADLNNYFNILTSLIEDINDGKVTFVKKRDDILKRIYNAYLIIRDGTDDSAENVDSISNSSTFLSPCVPTNSITVNLDANKDDKNIKEEYPKFSTDGVLLSGDTLPDEYYFSPFLIYIYKDRFYFVKYIYTMVDDTSDLKITSGNINIPEKGYVIPEKINITRGFDAETASADSKFILKMTLTTNFDWPEDYKPAISITGESNQEIKCNIGSISSNINSDNTTYEVILSIALDVKDGSEFDADNQCQQISLTTQAGNDTINTVNFNSSEKLKFSLSDTNMEFETAKALTFFVDLDRIMESNLALNEDENKVTLYEVPVVHSSFLTNKTNVTNKYSGFVKQLFTYISILEENVDKLETSTFFNLKFYNTCGISRFYNTTRTDVRLKLKIKLLESDKTDKLKNEIRSYIRRIVDKMNDSESLKVSTIISMLTNAETYGNYIDHITFIDLNDTFNQAIGKLTSVSDETTQSYPPEWLNLQNVDLIEFE